MGTGSEADACMGQIVATFAQASDLSVGSIGYALGGIAVGLGLLTPVIIAFIKNLRAVTAEDDRAKLNGMLTEFERFKVEAKEADEHCKQVQAELRDRILEIDERHQAEIKRCREDANFWHEESVKIGNLLKDWAKWQLEVNTEVVLPEDSGPHPVVKVDS